MILKWPLCQAFSSLCGRAGQSGELRPGCLSTIQYPEWIFIRDACGQKEPSPGRLARVSGEHTQTAGVIGFRSGVWERWGSTGGRGASSETVTVHLHLSRQPSECAYTARAEQTEEAEVSVVRSPIIRVTSLVNAVSLRRCQDHRVILSLNIE